MESTHSIIDGNEAAADVAYRLSEVVAIYPITPSSPMGELCDHWASQGRKNLFGSVPTVVEMQSEAGAAGAVHGALQAGSLATTFTSSQGLLLMIPNMYKIAGELSPAVIHVAARSVAAHALSIFGDHSDVMAARQTGWAMLAASSVQEAADLALICHAATLESRIPFVHFFDGFRTSHEINKVLVPRDDVLESLIDEKLVEACREKALTPDRPVLRGTAQNPDVFFQSREAANRYYAACPAIVQRVMGRFRALTGRGYRTMEYLGSPDAERVVVIMGSGADTAAETAAALNERGEKVGVLKVRLYRPFDASAFFAALPASAKTLAVLDRTKEPGSFGEPLYLDVASAAHELRPGLKIVAGRYGLSSKEFTPAMAKAVFDELAAPEPKRRFTVGIRDDVTNLSLDYDPAYSIERDDVVRAVFYGLGSDGTVGANKGSVKIIGEGTGGHVQAYFVYDSKKAGAMTISHLRFGPHPIRAPYLIERASFVACHQTGFLDRVDVLERLAPGGVFLLNTPAGPERAWSTLPKEFQEKIRRERIRLFVIDANRVARESGLGGRINTVMQAAFFKISGVLPPEQAIEAIRGFIRKTYGKKGEAVVAKNLKAVDDSLHGLHEVRPPAAPDEGHSRPPAFSPRAPVFVREVLGPVYAGAGDSLPVSAMPADGTFPTGTARWEKRSLAQELPVWDEDLCIQCGKCSIVCPHGAIRPKVYDPALLGSAPGAFKSRDAKDAEWKGLKYTLQVAPDDCTGCGICVDVCPAKDKARPGHKAIDLGSAEPLRAAERANWEYFLRLPDPDRLKIKVGSIRHEQFQRPLFEFSGACAGCGETPYLKLLTQLYGDRLLIANATGCSSIYGGNLPTTPWSADDRGRGPAWANSLFEDNAEFGLGLRLSVDQHRRTATELVQRLSREIGRELAEELLSAPQTDEAEILEQRARVRALKAALGRLGDSEAKRLSALADYLVRKSVWIVGGDGWAYDIGFGGLDHVLASGRNVKVLVLDTEVYSNTGGQRSKATPRGAIAKFSEGGSPSAKKDLGLMAMSYGDVYVASIAMGARDEHTLRVFLEAEAYDGPALIIAYSHCVAHGIDMATAMRHQKSLVETGRWLLYRFDPSRAASGQPRLVLDAKPSRISELAKSLGTENRFKLLEQTRPGDAKALFELAQTDASARWQLFEHLAKPLAPAPAAPAAQPSAKA